MMIIIRNSLVGLGSIIIWIKGHTQQSYRDGRTHTKAYINLNGFSTVGHVCVHIITL
jgi:hypothetical protein